MADRYPSSESSDRRETMGKRRYFTMHLSQLDHPPPLSLRRAAGTPEGLLSDSGAIVIQQGDCVVVMVKFPEPGVVKTRLAVNIGQTSAADLYRCFVRDVLRMVDVLPIQLGISIDPWQRASDFAAWLGPERRFLPQLGTDLGTRMDNAFLQIFKLGFERAVLIGSDIPDLPGSFIQDAFTALNNHDLVVGPAMDGGFYLIGWTKSSFHAQLMTAVHWSTPSVLAAALTIWQKAKLNIHLLDQWPDVDDLNDLLDLIERNALPDDSSTRIFLQSRHFC